MLLSNIRRLVTLEPGDEKVGLLGVIENAAVRIEGDHVVWCGPSSQLPKNEKKEEIIDCAGGTVLPGLVECHTHLIYAGSRESEFQMRSEGTSYGEIAQAGGGILSTVKATREASEEELFKLARHRADEALARGITTVEIKSGYGLDIRTEEKILKVAKRLGEEHDIDVVPTFLGAHVLPQEYRDKREEYVKLVIEEMLPQFARGGLCRFCDVFVEEGAFTPDEARAMGKTAKGYGLRMRLHVDQFSEGGGGELAAELEAISADHLDYVSDEGISAMSAAGVVGVMLPTATFFTGGSRYAPARKMVDKGVRIAVSTDFNPGTSPTLDLLLCATMAVTQMKLTVDEVYQAITRNAAASLGLADEIGSISPGKKADLVVFDAPDENYPLYRFGTNLVSKVIKDGKMVELKRFELSTP